MLGCEDTKKKNTISSITNWQCLSSKPFESWLLREISIENGHHWAISGNWSWREGGISKRTCGSQAGKIPSSFDINTRFKTFEANILMTCWRLASGMRGRATPSWPCRAWDSPWFYMEFFTVKDSLRQSSAREVPAFVGTTGIENTF